ncbi:MAG: recombinase family protein [Chloroflexota bacterium]
MKPERNRWVNFVAVSSGRQAEKESPKDQERENQKVIEAHGGICVATIRIEESRSIVRYDEAIGGNGAKGVEGYKLLDDIITNKKADFVVLRSMDRLARTTALSTTIQSLCEQAKITIYCRNSRPSDYEMETGRRDPFKQTIEALSSEMEVRNLSERIRMGRKASAKNGNFVTQPPFGYKASYDEGGAKKIVIVEEEARIVRYIFESVLSGMSQYRISKSLIELGTTHKGYIWHPARVHRILKRHRIYAGFSYFITADGEEVLASGKHEAIISEETAEKVLKELGRRRSFPRGVSSKRLFTRSLVCGKCGGYLKASGSLKTNKRGTRFVYSCRQARPDGSSSYCKKSVIYEDDLLDCVQEAIEYIVDGTAVEAFAKQCQDDLHQDYRAMLEDAKKRRDRHVIRRKRLLDLFVDGRVNIDDYETKLSEIEATLIVIENEINELEAVIEQDETPQEKLERLQKNLIQEPVKLANTDPIAFNAWIRDNINFVVKDRKVIECIYL